MSEYHLEAGIASLHCAAPTYEQADWRKILELYDMPLQLTPSPMNRAVAIGKARGPEEGLAELQKIPDPTKLNDYPFYPAAPGRISSSRGPSSGGGETL